MLLHITIIALQLAALAAFLILWFFWVRKKLQASVTFEEEEGTLLPFKHFSWILIGMVFLTCLAQVHFLRVSAQVHERMAGLAAAFQKQDQSARSVEELKINVEKLRKDVESSFKSLRAQAVEQRIHLGSAVPQADLNGPKPARSEKDPRTALHATKPDTDKEGFGREARASSSSSTKAKDVGADRLKAVEQNENAKMYSMALSRLGRVTTEQLRVRKRPQDGSPVVESLTSGQLVKVTEKRLLKDNTWFRVITPSGRAGWVDYRYLKLEGNV